MERWSGKIAVVTGASSGIGAAVCCDLAKAGLTVIGLARRAEKVEALKEKLGNVKGKLIAHQCDVSNLNAISETFDWIEKEYGGINILVNNAGIGRFTMILDNDNDKSLKEVIDTNLMGLIFCTKAAYRQLAKTGDYGHIININSIFGHGIPRFGEIPSNNVYPVTKYGVTAVTEVLRQELNYLKNNKVKVSSLSPGLVATDIIEAAGFPDADSIYKAMPHIMPEDISQAILYILGTPPNVQIHEMIIKPVGEHF